MERATIKDVARMANVSIATVSRVFNNKFDNIPISESTIERVTTAAKELHYSPNAVARSLVNRKTNIIGLIVPDIMHSYFPEMVRGVEGVAYNNGYQVILCDSEEDPWKERRLIQMLIERQIDGAIVAPASMDSRKSMEMLLERDIPVVLVDRHLGNTFDYVASDSYTGARIAVRHLVSLGHTRIAHIRGSEGLSSADETLKGYLDGLDEAGIVPDSQLIRGDGFYEQNGYDAMNEILGLDGHTTAVFAANDPIAIGAFQAIEESGLTVPDDIALVGSANLAFTHLLKVPLTTLDEQAMQIGEKAVSLLYERLGGYTGPVRNIQITPRLIIRKSCGSL